MPKQSAVFDKFRKINDKLAPDLIGVDELAVCTNAILDYKVGKPIKRGKWSRYDSNGYNNPNDILALNDIRTGNTDRVIASSGENIGILEKGVGWSDWIIGLTSGHKHRMAAYKDKFIFVFNTDDDPKMGDSDLSTFWDLEMNEVGSPEIGGIGSFHANGGNLGQNTLYKWVIVGQTEDGQLTPPSRPFTHLFDTGRDTTTDDDTLSTKICFTNLPYISDSRVVSRLIFRTKGTNEIGATTYLTGEVYYQAATLDNDSNGKNHQKEWEDNIADIDLGTEIVVYLNMPERSEFLTIHKDRLFLANFTQVARQFISPPSTLAVWGTHTGAGNQATVMTDSTLNLEVDSLIGRVIHNISDGSRGVITSNTQTTITCSAGLTNGTDNDFDFTDQYTLAPIPTQYSGYAYNDGGYMIDISDDGGGGSGTLRGSTQYDYRIHWVDGNNRLSRYYHDLTLTTSGGADHTITIHGIGMIDIVASKAIGRIKVYRKTGGFGKHYLIADADIQGDRPNGVGWKYYIDGEFVDLGGDSGLCDGAGNQAKMDDSTQNWVVNELIGKVIINITDGSQGTITSNTATQVTATLADGTDNDWDNGDKYTIVLSETWVDPGTNTTDHNSRVTFSNIEAPSEMQEENYALVFPEDGDAITGIYDDIDGVLVFKQKSICKIYTSGSPTNWRVVKLVENIGCSNSETLSKRGRMFRFIFNKRSYKYAFGMAEPEYIGLMFQTTLDTIVTWFDSTVTDEWYLIACQNSNSAYLVLVYDIKLDTWYKFTTDECKSIHAIQFGTDAGVIIGNNGGYVTEYNQPTDATRADTETGLSVDITPTIRTKTLKFPDQITKARLRKLKFRYTKVTGEDMTVAIVTDSASYVYTDNTGSGIKMFEKDISNAGKTTSVYAEISGSGFQEFFALRLDYRVIREGQAVGN